MASVKGHMARDFDDRDGSMLKGSRIGLKKDLDRGLIYLGGYGR